MPSYLRNAWYAAAWDDEIQGNALFARTLLGVPRLIYRKQDGSGYVMLEDRCPHRFAPLSLGTRNGDRVTCRYHGLEFGTDGRCTHSPYSQQPPAHAGVASTPVISRYGMLWFWPGDPTLADAAGIADFAFLDGQSIWRRYSHFGAYFELLADNLMDLSHVDHLHRESFNTNGGHSRGQQEVRSGAGQTLWNNWLIPGVNRAPWLEPHFSEAESIDQLLETRWDPPASMMLRISWMPAGTGVAGTRFVMINPHIITPETDTSSHYFWTCFPDEQSEAFARSVFEKEDKWIIEAVQQRMGGADFWDLNPMVLKGDVGAVRARRRLQKLRRQEAGAVE